MDASFTSSTRSRAIWHGMARRLTSRVGAYGATAVVGLRLLTAQCPAPDPAPPPDGSGARFSFAVIPDTQNETYAGEVRMQERVKWLVANRDRLDLRWALHTGDVHSWPTPPENGQFSAMSQWLGPLGTAGVPYVLTVGDHDTAAVCPGGSACPGQDASVGLRDTSAWNAYYSPARFGFEGVFEAGNVRQRVADIQRWGQGLVGAQLGALAPYGGHRVGQASGGRPSQSQRHRGHPRVLGQ